MFLNVKTIVEYIRSQILVQHPAEGDIDVVELRGSTFPSKMESRSFPVQSNETIETTWRAFLKYACPYFHTSFSLVDTQASLAPWY